MKVEKTEDHERGGRERKEKAAIKTEKEEEGAGLSDTGTGGGATAAPGAGRLVMTVDGQQKQLPFCQSDLLSTATMFDGDRVSPAPPRRPPPPSPGSSTGSGRLTSFVL